jgi:DNA-binding LytR/AlgR family response regulator
MKDPKKCIIVDDEPAAHYVLINYIRQNPELELVHQCYNGIEVMNYLRENPVDIMFLDIDMPEITGLELLKILPSQPKTILTTAYSEFALESYDYGVIDYLLKPIYFPRFLKSIERFLATQADRKVIASNLFISIKADGAVIDLDVRKILFAQSYGNYVKIFTTGRTYLASMTTNELEASLPAEQFLRVHKSYIVAIDKIEANERDTLVVSSQRIPVGITYRRELERLLAR